MPRPQRRLSRREAKEVTRKRLIEGAIEILRSEGVAAATTGRIADAAGIAQSSFYSYFADRDACLEAAAEKIGGYVLRKARERTARFDRRDMSRSIREVYASVLDDMLSAPELTRIFLRHREDDASPMGRAFRGLVERARADLRADFARFGLAGRRQLEVEVYPDLLVGALFGAVEGLLSGRLHDRDAVLDGLSKATHATLSAALARKADG